MNTYLLTWNPKRWTWDSIEEDIKEVDETGKCLLNWSCGNNKSIQIGDRIFLARVGTEPKGVIGAGFAKSEVFQGEHWSREENKIANYISADFETLINPDKDEILSLETLKNNGVLSQQNWTPEASGNSIKPEVVDELERVWFNFLTTQSIRYNPFLLNKDKSEKIYFEGTPHRVLLTKYERNPFARKVCIDNYGLSCVVCDFNFEKTYGEIGRDFIHVHHVRQLSNIGERYSIDPIKDLKPVCPNCHSMIHRTKTPLTIEELKNKLKKE